MCEATEKDVDLAVKAARAAFEGEWRQTTPAVRGQLLNKLADLTEKNIKLLAAVEALDNGKSFAMAQGDIGAVIETLRYYAGWADKITGQTMDINPDTFHYSRHEPVRFVFGVYRKHHMLTVAADWRLRTVRTLAKSPFPLYSC